MTWGQFWGKQAGDAMVYIVRLALMALAVQGACSVAASGTGIDVAMDFGTAFYVAFFLYFAVRIAMFKL